MPAILLTRHGDYEGESRWCRVLAGYQRVGYGQVPAARAPADPGAEGGRWCVKQSGESSAVCCLLVS